jgi:hypothetical protein
MRAKRDIEMVVGTQMPQWGARQMRDGRYTVRVKLLGLENYLLAGYSEQNEARKHDEETDRMIREAVQNCHWIERKKEIDEMLYKIVFVLMEKDARLKK